MYCSMACDTSRNLYAIPLEPFPDPSLFSDCGMEHCNASTTGPTGTTGPGCLFDMFDPKEFNKPCCKSGCCATCERMGNDAPFLAPHVLSCASVRNHYPWTGRLEGRYPGQADYAAKNAADKAKPIEITVRIGNLPTCECLAAGLKAAKPNEAACDKHIYDYDCCIPVTPPFSAYYTVMCIRARGVPHVEFWDTATAPAFTNDRRGYKLTIRPTIYMEVLLKDCCGYMYTVKTSFTFLNRMLMTFDMHCRLCDLGPGLNLYFKSKVQLCPDSDKHIPATLGGDEGVNNRRFKINVNLAVDACVIRHLPYDMCGSEDFCLTTNLTGPLNITDPECAFALDTPYMVPFPLACARIREEPQESLCPGDLPEYSPCPQNIPGYTCGTLPTVRRPSPFDPGMGYTGTMKPALENGMITLPTFLPGVAPWTVIDAGGMGHTDVIFNDCIPNNAPGCTGAGSPNPPCMTQAACDALYKANCESHTLDFKLRTPLSIVIRDYIGDVYTFEVIYWRDMQIKLGAPFSVICNAWLYAKTKFKFCCTTPINLYYPSQPTQLGKPYPLSVDVSLEACVMKLIPYQVTGRNPYCNIGQWYHKDYCRFPACPKVDGRGKCPNSPTITMLDDLSYDSGYDDFDGFQTYEEETLANCIGQRNAEFAQETAAARARNAAAAAVPSLEKAYDKAVSTYVGGCRRGRVNY